MKRRYIIILCILALIAGIVFQFVRQKESSHVPISNTVIGYDEEYRDILFPGLTEPEIQAKLDQIDDAIHQMSSKEEIDAFIQQQPKGIFVIVHYTDEDQK